MKMFKVIGLQDDVRGCSKGKYTYNKKEEDGDFFPPPKPITKAKTATK